MLEDLDAPPEFTADVLYDFFSPGQVTIGGTSLDNELGKTWCDVGAQHGRGVSAQCVWTAGISVQLVGVALTVSERQEQGHQSTAGEPRLVSWSPLYWFRTLMRAERSRAACIHHPIVR
jgi:hypothetical protein